MLLLHLVGSKAGHRGRPIFEPVLVFTHNLFLAFKIRNFVTFD